MFIILEGPAVSKNVYKCFSFDEYGGKEEAKKTANAWRQKHTLKEGMVFV